MKGLEDPTVVGKGVAELGGLARRCEHPDDIVGADGAGVDRCDEAKWPVELRGGIRTTLRPTPARTLRKVMITVGRLRTLSQSSSAVGPSLVRSARRRCRSVLGINC